MAKKTTKVEAVSIDTVSAKTVLQDAMTLSKSLDQLYRAKPTSELYSAIVTAEGLIRLLLIRVYFSEKTKNN